MRERWRKRNIQRLLGEGGNIEEKKDSESEKVMEIERVCRVVEEGARTLN